MNSVAQTMCSNLPVLYHWRELPQVSFFIFVTAKVVLWQTCVCHDKHVSVMTKHTFCHDKSMLVTTKDLFATNTILLQQNFCRDKLTFIAINMFVLRQNTSFVATKVCSSWQNFYCDKHMFVMPNICHAKWFVRTKIFYHDKIMTKVLSQQGYFCCDKRHVLLRQTHVCRDKTFVVTKIILVAAPANDSSHLILRLIM